MEIKLHELYERTVKNCLFYEKEGEQLHLLNEIGVLRGIASCLECFGSFEASTEFTRLIALQQKLKAQERMLKDICSYLAGQDGQLEKEIIPALHFNYGYTTEEIANAGICTKQEAEQYISDYQE